MNTLSDAIRRALRPVTWDPLARFIRASDPGKSAYPDGKRFPGVCKAAEGLGVSRFHLYRVLRGERRSHRLMAEYRKLKREAA